MKQLLILSGKGGTGKTTIAGAFIKLASAKNFADVDVDAPNLHLVLNDLSLKERNDHYGLDKALINSEVCISCGVCRDNCSFSAIEFNKEYHVINSACEGCGLCVALCPVQAISFVKNIAGELMWYQDNSTNFSTAKLKAGNGNSGLLVSEVKKQLKNVATENGICIIDGSPGIGCPVIASISGVDLVLIVAEPSISGISDLKRIVKTCRQLETNMAICVNKADINMEMTNEIIDFCNSESIPYVGSIPFDKEIVKAINAGLTIVEIESLAKVAIENVFNKTIELLK